MQLELPVIIISFLVLFLIHFARIKSVEGKTFLFSTNFLNKADEIIFDLVKFVFKLYELLFHNISVFIEKIPHKVIKMIHKVSHFIAGKSSVWIEKITYKSPKQ